MKRTPLKRRKALVRMLAGFGIVPRAPLKRDKKLRPVGKRGKADRDALSKLRPLVMERDDWRCQRCRKLLCQPLDVHHRRARAQGGRHTLANLVTLGRPCHDAVTDHTAPDWREWIDTRKGT